MSEPLLAEEPRPEGAPDGDRAVPRSTEDTSGPASARAAARFPEIISFPPQEDAARPGRTLPPGPRRDLPLPRQQPHGDRLRGKGLLKQGTIYSYSGNLTFWVKERRPGGQPALVIITGTGQGDPHRQGPRDHVHAGPDETVYVEPAHLLACEEGSPRATSLGERGGLEVLALEGRGMVALSVASKPLTLTVTPGLPVSVPAVFGHHLERRGQARRSSTIARSTR